MNQLMSNYLLRRNSAILFFLIVLCFSSAAQNTKPLFRDSVDNAFDVSKWLIQKEGFLPIPSLITEPSVGYGVGFAAVFFHSSFLKRKGPPNMSGLAGAYTQNGTWAAAVFHRGYWKEDRYRYTGAVAKTFINIDFYGSGNKGVADTPALLNMDSWIILQQFYSRLGNSNFFIGGRYIYYPTKNKFSLPIDIPEFQELEFESNISEATLMLNYDSRNNVFTPTKGMYIEATGTYSDTWFGGAAQYGRLGFTFLGFSALDNKFSLGTRLDQRYAIADLPFYLRPMVDLRGVPLMKYQNKMVHTLEMELNFNIYKRYHLLAFTGMGNAFSDFSSISEGKSVTSIGTGFRYEIARLFGARMGMDFAWSKDDFAFYIVFGHIWMK